MSVNIQNYKQVYQFKITLKGIRPSIWRRIQVPESYSFWDLHVAIQDAMGWEDGHLHEFKIADPASKVLFTIGLRDDEYHPATSILRHFLEDHKVPIREWFALDNNRAEYLYDFGDCWEHTVQLEKILPRRSGLTYPVCLGGKRACPPEDAGGVSGYLEKLEIMQDPSHPEHEEIVQWMGKCFDSDSFACGDVVFDDPVTRWNAAIEDNPFFYENTSSPEP